MARTYPNRGAADGPVEVSGILLDIEGTTSPITFVTGVLFPFARRELGAFLERTWDEAETVNALDLIARDMGAGSLASLRGDRPAAEVRAQVEAQVLKWMDEDKKLTGLKELQGLIWRRGYESGELVSQVYDDVPPAIAAWRALGCEVRIYSSGSVAAQKLYFGHSDQGDLRPLLSGYHDTTVGPKRARTSYAVIAKRWRLPPAHILFLSDVPAELDAAAAAGMHTALVVRPGNEPVVGSQHRSLTSFGALLIKPPAPPVLPLDALDRGMIGVCGGKAANLGELIRAGFPVPDGFCVTTPAYSRMADGAALTAILDEIEAAPAGEISKLEALAAKVRAAILEAPVPDGVAGAVEAAYKALGEGADVAVRSSATAEDLPDASFAGQQDTYLHVRGAPAVIDAVRRCWASLWTDRAVAYRAKNGIEPHAVRLAVVVQKMVPAAVAGVLFTADPVTGKRRRAVIDASPGLGEAVVSGAVNPDHFEVDTASNTIEARRLGDKRVTVEAAPGGGTRRVEREASAKEACLTDKEILEIARLGTKVEIYYSAPQDTEWALDEERRLWLLQARPITTLFPLPEGAPSSGEDARVYLNFNVAQGVFRPFSRMGVQLWRLLPAGIAQLAGFDVPDPELGVPIMTEAAGRIFVDLTPLVRNDLGRRALSYASTRMEARSAPLLAALFEDPRFALRPFSRGELMMHFARIAVRTRIPLRILRFLSSPGDGAAWCREAGDEALARGEVAEDASAEERLAAARRLLHEAGQIIFPRVVPVFATGMLSWVLAKKLLEGMATPEELDTAFRALPHNPTTEMDLRLWKLSARARKDPESYRVLREVPPSDLSLRYRHGELPRVLQRGLEAFLEEYGARGVAEIDIGVTRWSEDPSHVLGMLSNYVSHAEGAEPADEQFNRLQREAEAMVAELVRRARSRGALRGEAVEFFLSRMRALAGLREAPKFQFVRVIGRARQLLLSVGKALVYQGRLSTPGDVFMLDFAEVRDGLGGKDLRELADERRADQAREMGRRRLPRLLLSDGTEPEALLRGAGQDADGSRLTGTPASAGRVTARARVILDPTGAKLEKGEILVAPSTDPGWTPLFLTAGGLVMEMGGAMSHGAVVAREYGIPAVVGVAGATDRIQTGQEVTVDGAAGTVELK